MKYVVQFSRVLVGLLFILSGLLKLNDPTGFSYKMEEYFAVFSQDLEAKQDTVVTQISFLEEQVEIKTPLYIHSSKVQFTVQQSPWQVGISDDGQPLWTSTISVYENGNSVFESKHNAIDSMATKGEVRITSTVSGNSLIQEEISTGMPSIEATSVEAELTSYIKPNGWAVNFFKALGDGNNPLIIAILMSWLEAILGFALLIGWQRRFTAWMLVLITAFFTFLTLYSWIYDKVTDCGCFGDALPMNPEESFYKNVVIGVFIAIIFFWNKYIKPVFSNPFGVKVLTVLTVLLIGFSVYCKHYLPVVDFLHYGEGTDIRKGMEVPEGERATAHMQTIYEYGAKDGSGEIVEVVYDSDKNSFEPKIDYSKWKYIRVKEEKILEEAYEPPVHDFAFYDAEQSNNYIDDFWKQEQKLLVVMHDVNKANTKAIGEIRDIARQWKEQGKEFWALTASSKQEVEEFRHKHQISEFEFYYGDNTNLKSIIRSNPGLLLIKDTSVVEKTWPSTRLPKFKRILKKSE